MAVIRFALELEHEVDADSECGSRKIDLRATRVCLLSRGEEMCTRAGLPGEFAIEG